MTPFLTASDVDRAASTAKEPEDRAMAAVFREQEGAGDSDSPWRLLAHVFGMLLRPGDAKEPFGPMFEFEDGRSMAPSDLTPEQLATLRTLLDSVSDPEVQARLGDVLWVTSRDAQAAQVAVRGYIASGVRLESPDMWLPAMERYERAVRLACTLGRRGRFAQEALAHVEARAVALDGAYNGHFTQRLLALLEEFRAGDPKPLVDIALKAAERHRGAGAFDLAREYYQVAARLLQRQRETGTELDARRALAETFVEQAKAEDARGNCMASHHLWEQAIQAFRTVPGGKARMPELHRRLEAAGRETLKLMRPVGTTIDIEEEVEATRKAMSGLGFTEAVLSLAHIGPILDPERLREEVERNAERFLFSALFGSKTMDAQGRTVHKAPALHVSDPDERKAAVLAGMESAAALERDFRCHAFILPALWTLLQEHDVAEEDIAALLAGSRFIPEDRMEFFASGFAAGFRRDFAVALHLLVPQVEHSLRLFLARAGVITTSIDEEGIQEEWPLGRVLGTPELEGIITPLLVFEFRGLLVAKGGANLRNRMSHGMMAPGEFNTSPALYLWWLLLRVCLIGTPANDAFQQSGIDADASDNAPAPPGSTEPPTPSQ